MKYELEEAYLQIIFYSLKNEIKIVFYITIIVLKIICEFYYLFINSD